MGGSGGSICDHVAAFVIPFNLICNMTMGARGLSAKYLICNMTWSAKVEFNLLRGGGL